MTTITYEDVDGFDFVDDFEGGGGGLGSVS